MSETADFETLVLLCRRASSLPPLPATALRLIKEIDGGDASAAQLERIISSDPALTAAFMRWGAIEDAGDDMPAVTCIRSSILLHGQRAIRNLAVSMLVQNAIRTPVSDCEFDARLCARHCVFVGILAHYIAVRSGSRSSPRSDITDVFAAGVLHDLPIYLLARMAPHIYNRVDRYSRKREVSLVRGFEMLFGKTIGELGAATCEVWQLPSVFVRYMRHLSEPWMAEELERGVCAIRYADWMAGRTDWRLESWDVRDELPLEVLEEVGVPETEQDMVLERVAAMAESYCPSDPVGRVISARAR